MWDDEDNNPYGSFQRRDSERSDATGADPHAATPQADLATSDDAIPPASATLHDEELASNDTTPPEPVSQKDRYDSRIEQILHEHPDLDIQITQAGKNTEGGGGYITYTIRTGVRD